MVLRLWFGVPLRKPLTDIILDFVCDRKSEINLIMQ